MQNVYWPYLQYIGYSCLLIMKLSKMNRINSWNQLKGLNIASNESHISIYENFIFI